MNNSLLLLAGILFVLLISGCTQTGQVVDVGDNGDVDENGGPVVMQCPDTCDDGNECTADLCDEKSDFECRNVPRWGVSCGEAGYCQDGVCIEQTDNCSALTEMKDLESCYQKEYFSLAVKTRNELVCDVIRNDQFKGRCYASVGTETDDPTVCEGLENVVSRDACYFQYASDKANEYVFAKDACDRITDVEIMDECLALEEFVTAPVGMFLQVKGDTQVNTFVVVVLLDRKGRSTTAEGNLTVSILQVPDKDVKEYKDIDLVTLFSIRKEITESDYRFDRIVYGLDDTGIFVAILKEDLKIEPVRNDARLYVTFATKDGKFISKQTDFSWDTGLAG